MSILLTDAKSRLLKRHVELTRLRAHHSEQQLALDASDELDWPDRAALHEDEEVLNQLSERERIELAEINAALKRIADGRYGSCERCGEAIAPARLAALPEGRCCIDCQG